MEKRRQVRRPRAFLTQMHSDEFMRGGVPSSLTEETLATVLDAIVTEYPENMPGAYWSLISAINAIADALDDPNVEIKLKIYRSGKDGARKSDAQYFEDFQTNKLISEFVWNQISTGRQKKYAISMAEEKFALGSSSIYAAVKKYALMMETHTQAENAFRDQESSAAYAKSVAFRPSSEFERWLESFTISKRKKAD